MRIVAGQDRGRSVTILEAILSYLLAQPVHKSDSDEPPESRRERVAEVARAIASVAGKDAGKAAFLAVQAVHESGLRRDVLSCNCPRHECDRGKARGAWQLHRIPERPEIWSLVCGGDYASHALGASWIARYYSAKSLECSFAALGGVHVSCGVEWARSRATEARRLARKVGAK